MSKNGKKNIDFAKLVKLSKLICKRNLRMNKKYF